MHLFDQALVGRAVRVAPEIPTPLPDEVGVAQLPGVLVPLVVVWDGPPALGPRLALTEGLVSEAHPGRRAAAVRFATMVTSRPVVQ